MSSADPRKERKTAEPRTEKGADPCRCKETAQMSPRDLLKLMINDLAFWKKLKK